MSVKGAFRSHSLTLMRHLLLICCVVSTCALFATLRFEDEAVKLEEDKMIRVWPASDAG